ncbi:MAG TPA: GNAT family N-acetyltransferase [Dongiaceae bacterium]|nr:GNAT family N-acetyltransferase [Dongiaceae bacterium]
MDSDLKVPRYAKPDDLRGIEQLVSRVVLECYGHLLSSYKFDADENWPGSWVVESEGEVVGVMLTDDDWVEDLWIAVPHRNRGIGAQLLSIAESEIAERGYEVARLRVVAENGRALRFYARHGWAEGSRYAHEINGFEMLEMMKRVGRRKLQRVLTLGPSGP